MSDLNRADIGDEISKNSSFVGKVNIELTQEELVSQTVGTAIDIAEQRELDDIKAARRQFADEGDPVDKITTFLGDKKYEYGDSKRQEEISKKQEGLIKTMEALPIKYWPVVDHVLQDIYDRPTTASGPDAKIEERHERMLKAYDLVTEQIKDGSLQRVVDQANTTGQQSRNEYQIDSRAELS